VIAEANGPEGSVVEPTFPIEVKPAALIRFLRLCFGALGLRAVLLQVRPGVHKRRLGERGRCGIWKLARCDQPHRDGEEQHRGDAHGAPTFDD
jgi:hypothetical protein